MAKLDKLQICGIRSFNPDRDESIKFGSPLTLLMGENGCGKTTIIESIKYALTATLPAGCNSGQGFVNDPNMCKKHSTKAYIKLRYKDANDRTIIVGRFLSVTKKGDGKLSFSSTAPSIRVQRGGEEVDVSGRCLDIDEFCAQALNVPPSILNNVLFCHQENSFWPLDEPVKLKAKFDEIFDSVRYNECGKNLRALYAGYNKDIRDMRKDLGYLKENVQRTQDKRDLLQARQSKLASIIELIDAKETALVPLDNRMEKILGLENELAHLQSDFSKQKTKKEIAVDEQNRIRKHIPEIFEGSDEQLQKKIDSFEENRRTTEKSLKLASDKKIEIERNISKVQHNKEQSQLNIAKLQEEKNQFNKLLKESGNLILQSRQKLNITTKSDEFDLNQRHAILVELKMALNKSLELFKDLEALKESEGQELQKDIDCKRERFLEVKHTIDSKMKEINENDIKIRDLKVKINNLQSSMEPLKRLESKRDEMEENLNAIKRDSNEAEKLKEIETDERSLVRFERSIEDLEAKHKILVENQIRNEKIDNERDAINKKETQIKEIKYKNNSLFHQVFKNNIPKKNFKENVTEILQRREQNVKDSKSRFDEKQRQATTLETSIKHKKKEKDNMEKEIESKEASILKLTNGKSFTTVLETSYRKKEKLQRDKGQFTSGKIIYEQFITKFEESNPCCPICETNFKNKVSEINRIIAKLKKTTEQIPSSLEKVTAELEQEENFYNKLQQLEPVHQQIAALKTDLPRLEAELKEMEATHSTTLTQLKQLKHELDVNESVIKNCRSLISDATLLDEYMSDMENSQSNLNALLKNNTDTSLHAGGNTAQTKQHIEMELDNIKATEKSLRSKIVSSRKNVENNRQRVNSLITEIQETTNRILEYKKQSSQEPIMIKQKSELEAKNAELREELVFLSAERHQYEAELKKSEQEKKDIEEKNRILIEEHRSKIDESKELVNSVVKLQTQIDNYRKSNFEEKLSTAIEKGKSIEEELKKVIAERNQIVDEISAFKDKQVQEQIDFRCYQDNLTLREKQAEEKRLNEEIKALEKKIGDHDYKTVYAEKKALNESIKATNNEINTMNGRKGELENMIKENEKELQRPEHKNASLDYRKKSYEVSVTEILIKDLGKYINALDASILQFHKERMLQINKIIRELWVNIYRGNDIEYIEIQTEMAANTTAQRRSYNYKVMQFKSGVSLEMRGRCSAGQKVLACMIIRMALAEAFSSTCGILTLDEPTTNLDQANIKSLSAALSNIIKAREHERNFQLIIISHDEEFLREINHNDNISLVWKVDRDENGFSIVKKFNL